MCKVVRKFSQFYGHWMLVNCVPGKTNTLEYTLQQEMTITKECSITVLQPSIEITRPVTRNRVTSGEVCFTCGQRFPLPYTCIPFQVITLEQPRLQWCNFTTVNVLFKITTTYPLFSPDPMLFTAQYCTLCWTWWNLSRGWRHFLLPTYSLLTL